MTDTGFTKYKPSVIAAAVVIAVCELLFRDGNVNMSACERCWLSLLKTGHVNTVSITFEYMSELVID